MGDTVQECAECLVPVSGAVNTQRDVLLRPRVQSSFIAPALTVEDSSHWMRLCCAMARPAAGPPRLMGAHWDPRRVSLPLQPPC
jgi:hypothetical protein